MGQHRGEFAARVATEEGRDKPHPEQQVSAWINGDNIASPARVFAIERALGVEPGSLSHLLGYLPVSARDIRTVEQAVAFEPGLTPTGRANIMAVYQVNKRTDRGSDHA